MKILNEALKNNLICFASGNVDWKKAIQQSCVTLEKEGYITGEYSGEIINTIEEYGPYIVIIPNVAIPHSTVGSGSVIKTGISITKFDTPIKFYNNENEIEAEIFFTIASENADEHLANIQELSNLLENEALLDRLLNMKDMKEFKEITKG